MTLEALAAQVRDAGYFAQFLPWGSSVCIESAIWDDKRACAHAPLIHTFQDSSGRWMMSVFGEEYVQIPNEGHVLPATLDILREMGRDLVLPITVIERYQLIRIDPAEFGTDDE